MPDPKLELARFTAWDFSVSGYDGWTLTIAAGSPLNLSNPTAFIRLGGVRYLRCPTEFHHARFRAPMATELEEINAVMALENADMVVAFDAETQGALGSRGFIVVAETCEIVHRVVQLTVQPDGPAFGGSAS